MVPFIVLGLPRSRTYWLSRFLSYGSREVEHDPSRFFGRLSDAWDYFAPDNAAAADTALGMLWPKISAHLRPDLLVVVIHRPYLDVKASLDRLDGTMGVGELELFAVRLHGIRGLHVPYARLDEEAGCAEIFEYALRRPFHREWWESLRHQNLQCDREAYTRDAIANAVGVSAVFGHDRSVTA